MINHLVFKTSHGVFLKTERKFLHKAGRLIFHSEINNEANFKWNEYCVE